MRIRIVAISDVHLSSYKKTAAYDFFEKALNNRRFVYTTYEYLEFIKIIIEPYPENIIGFHFDIGHARNNNSLNNIYPINICFSLLGLYFTGMHLHQVVTQNDKMKNHSPIKNIFGSLISFPSLFYDFKKASFPPCPMFIEVKTSLKDTKISLNIFKKLLERRAWY